MTVNAVCPGFVDTPMTDDSRGAHRQRTRAAARTKRAKSLADDEPPMAGWCIPTRSRRMILTLCLPQSRDVNGAAITIDGGTTA